MTEIIAFPDAEALFVSYLGGLLDVPVSTAVPNPRPDDFVRVQRIGGTRRDLIVDSSMIVFECWGSDGVRASEIARRARAYVGATRGETVAGVQVYGVHEIGGPSYFPDANTNASRYQFTVAIDLRGEPLT